MNPLTTPRTVRAPRGTTIRCRGWLQEAALRMLMPKLHAMVAEVEQGREGAEERHPADRRLPRISGDPAEHDDDDGQDRHQQE